MVDAKAGNINDGGGIILSNAYCSHGGVYSVNPSLVKVDFSSNVNPLGISKMALKSIQKNGLDFLHYTLILNASI